MQREPDEFDAIIAGWERSGAAPRWPTHDRDDRDDRDPDYYPDDPDDPDDPAGAGPRTDPEGSLVGLVRTPNPRPDGVEPDTEGHFVPPEPPPLPRLGPPGLVGLGLIGLGLLLCVAPSVVGVPSTYGVPLGFVVLAAGLVWLVLRLWPDPPPRGDGDGVDDGAVL